MSDKMPKHDDADVDEMLPEYDFSGGIRGKHYRAFQRGYKVIIHKVGDPDSSRGRQFIVGGKIVTRT